MTTPGSACRRALMPRERTQRGLRRAGRGDARPRGPGADPDRQREGVHRPVQPPAGRGAVRPDLPGERDRAPADPAPVADHHRQDRAVPPARCAPSSTPPGCSPACRAAQAGARRVGGLLQHRAAAPGHSDMAHPDAPVQPAAAPRTGRPQPRDPCASDGPDRTGETGSPAGSPPTASSASAWQQVSVGKHRAGAAATSWSPTDSCSSGSATSCSRPSPGPAPGR